MGKIVINPQDLRAVRKKLKTLDNFQQWADKPMEQSLSILRDDIANAPRKAPGAFTRLATPGQRRAYWAKVSRGEARHGPGGYIRTGLLVRNWTTKITKRMRGLVGVVSNVVMEKYGQYVHGPYQQPFHAVSKWRRIDKVIETNRPTIERIFKRAIDRVLAK
jgi:hypothetical protein